MAAPARAPPAATTPDASTAPSTRAAVRVVVHVRPLLPAEAAAGASPAVAACARPPSVDCGGSRFSFDAVYGAGAGDPGALYAENVAPVVEGAFRGIHGAVLAYGATGSGKTHTMGVAATPAAGGVIPAALDDLCERADAARAAGASVSLSASCVEILGEDVRDLLAAGRPAVALRDGADGVEVAGATAVDVADRQALAALVAAAAAARATAATAANASSSRSHAVVSVDVRVATSLTTTRARLHLVDLAGSERAAVTQAAGARLREGAAINRGLLALGNVISALASRRPHVPYRDSKVTRLLADALGGRAATVLIACAAPARASAGETRATLRYASRARAVVNSPTVNADPVAAELGALRAENAALRGEVAALRAALADRVVVAAPPAPAAATVASTPPPPSPVASATAERYLAEAAASRARAAALVSAASGRAALGTPPAAPAFDHGPLAAGLGRAVLAPRAGNGGPATVRGGATKTLPRAVAGVGAAAWV